MTTMTEQRLAEWSVVYEYDGGRANPIVQAPDAETAAAAVMAEARPTYSSNPDAPCRLVSVARVMRYDEMAAAVNGGLRRAINIAWMDRDTGGDFLVIERCSTVRNDPGLPEYWPDEGRIVSTARTRQRAERLAHEERMRRQASDRIDVVHRSEVEVAVVR